MSGSSMMGGSDVPAPASQLFDASQDTGVSVGASCFSESEHGAERGRASYRGRDEEKHRKS